MNEQRDRQKKSNLRMALWLGALALFFFVAVIAQHLWK
jgi:hypothetical protein